MLAGTGDGPGLRDWDWGARVAEPLFRPVTPSDVGAIQSRSEDFKLEPDVPLLAEFAPLATTAAGAEDMFVATDLFCPISKSMTSPYGLSSNDTQVDGYFLPMSGM